MLHATIYFFPSVIWRGSNINGKLHLLQLNLLLTLKYLQSAFQPRAWLVTHVERMLLPEEVAFRRYQKCWRRAGITRQSNSDFVRKRICLPLASSLVSGQSVRSSPFGCAAGTRLGDQMSPLRQLRVPPRALEPTRVFLCGDYIELTGSRLIVLLLLQKGWVGCYPACQNLCPKSTKPHTCSGSSTRANIFMQLFVGFDFQIKFHEQSFNTAAFKKTSEKIHIYIYHRSVFNCEFVTKFSKHFFRIGPTLRFGLFPSSV